MTNTPYSYKRVGKRVPDQYGRMKGAFAIFFKGVEIGCRYFYTPKNQDSRRYAERLASRHVEDSNSRWLRIEGGDDPLKLL